MFGWFKKEKSSLYQAVEATLEEEGRWSVKEGSHGGWWVFDSKTKTDWNINSICNEWYVALPAQLQPAESYGVAGLLFRKLVRPALKKQREEQARQKEQTTKEVLDKYTRGGE